MHVCAGLVHRGGSTQQLGVSRGLDRRQVQRLRGQAHALELLANDGGVLHDLVRAARVEEQTQLVDVELELDEHVGHGTARRRASAAGASGSWRATRTATSWIPRMLAVGAGSYISILARSTTSSQRPDPISAHPRSRWRSTP